MIADLRLQLLNCFKTEPHLAVKDCFEAFTFKCGEFIYRQGNTLKGVYFIEKGKAKCFKHLEDNVNRIIRIAGEKNFIGCKEALVYKNYTLTVQAWTDATLYLIPRKIFLDTINSKPQALHLISRMLSHDFMETENTLLNIHNKPMRARIAFTLLWLDHR